MVRLLLVINPWKKRKSPGVTIGDMESTISVHHELGAATASCPRAMSSETHIHDPPCPLPPRTSTVLRTGAGGRPPAAGHEHPRNTTLRQLQEDSLDDLIERGEVAEGRQGESGEQMWIYLYDPVLELRPLLATNQQEDLAGVGLVLEAPRGLCSRAHALVSWSALRRAPCFPQRHGGVRICGADDLRCWCAGRGHLAPCVVKDLVEGSASHACGGISRGDILLCVDNVPVLQIFAQIFRALQKC